MMQYKAIAESNNFIVLDKFTKYYEINDAPAVYQTESVLELEFIQDKANIIDSSSYMHNVNRK